MVWKKRFKTVFESGQTDFGNILDCFGTLKCMKYKTYM